MAQTLSKDEILNAIWEKHEAIYDFLQELNERLKTSTERRKYEGVMANGVLEIQRLEAVYDMIYTNKPITYPSDEQVHALALATGELQSITDRNTAYSALIDAATELIKTWPVSGGEPEE